MNGKRALLRRLILGFRDGYADVCGRLAALVEQGLPEEAARLAHSLRGVAASLELTQIAQIVRQFEDSVGAGQDDQITGLLLALDDAIRPAVAAADQLEGAPSLGAAVIPRNAMQAINFAAAAYAREVLRDQIVRQSLSARRGFDNFADAMGMTLAERDSDPIGVAILQLNYDAALALLDSDDTASAPLSRDLSA